MPRYEYRIFSLIDLSQTQKKLNEHAKEGFELDTFQVVHTTGHRPEFYIVVKRELKE